MRQRDRTEERSRLVAGSYRLQEHGTIGGNAKTPPIAEIIAAASEADWLLDGPSPDPHAFDVPSDGSAGTLDLTFSRGEDHQRWHFALYRMPSGNYETIGYPTGV